jgi:5'-phosphate synthase pdxT subunit
MTRIGVLALQGDFAEHTQVLRDLGAQPVEVRLPEELKQIDALIIPGGESTTIARLLAAFQLLEPLQALLAAGLPAWGTCAGAIILAKRAPELDRPNLHAMDIGVRRNFFGNQADSFEADLPITVLGDEPFHAVFIRAPIIADVGPGVDVLARLDDGTIVAARQASLLATAFHPELTGDGRFHRYFLDLVQAGTEVASTHE